MSVPAAPPSRIRQALGPGLRAVAHNWRPFVLIQIGVALTVVAYYTTPLGRSIGDTLAVWKAQGGLWFPAISTALAAGVLPEIARRLTKAPRSRPFTLSEIVFQFVFFSILGIMIDRLYWGLGVIFGDTPDLLTVVKKVLADMLLFSTIVSMPFSIVSFAWKDAGFSIERTRRVLAHGEFLRRYVPTLVMCWLFWVPVVSALYALPVSLQFILALLAEAAWALLLVHMATHPG